MDEYGNVQLTGINLRQGSYSKQMICDLQQEVLL